MHIQWSVIKTITLDWAMLYFWERKSPWDQQEGWHSGTQQFSTCDNFQTQTIKEPVKGDTLLELTFCNKGTLHGWTRSCWSLQAKCKEELKERTGDLERIHRHGLNMQGWGLESQVPVELDLARDRNKKGFRRYISVKRRLREIWAHCRMDQGT